MTMTMNIAEATTTTTTATTATTTTTTPNGGDSNSGASNHAPQVEGPAAGPTKAETKAKAPFDRRRELDYTLNYANERMELVQEIVGDIDDPNSYSAKCADILSKGYSVKVSSSAMARELTKMADYVLHARDNPSGVEITPKNDSFATKRNVASLEGVMETEGEAHMRPVVKRNTYTNPKPRITEHDLATMPPVRELREAIEYLESVNQAVKGSLKHYRLRHLFISMRREQYALKDIFTKEFRFLRITRSEPTDIDYLQDTYATADNGERYLVSHNTIDLTNSEHVYQIFRHYAAMRQQVAETPWRNIAFLLTVLDDIVEKSGLSAARQCILEMKIDGASNNEIVEVMRQQHGLNYLGNYISSIFRQEICKKVAFTAKLEYDKWAERDNPDSWKVCTGCGETKLRDERMFVRKKGAYDGLSSRCKECDRVQREKRKERMRNEG